MAGEVDDISTKTAKGKASIVIKKLIECTFDHVGRNTISLADHLSDLTSSLTDTGQRPIAMVSLQDGLDVRRSAEVICVSVCFEDARYEITLRPH